MMWYGRNDIQWNEGWECDYCAYTTRYVGQRSEVHKHCCGFHVCHVARARLYLVEDRDVHCFLYI